jgi:hypothetical protein
MGCSEDRAGPQASSGQRAFPKLTILLTAKLKKKTFSL